MYSPCLNKSNSESNIMSNTNKYSTKLYIYSKETELEYKDILNNFPSLKTIIIFNFYILYSIQFINNNYQLTVQIGRSNSMSLVPMT